MLALAVVTITIAVRMIYVGGVSALALAVVDMR